MKTLKEIEDNLLQLNQKISLKFIGMRKNPTEWEMRHINREIGEAIKSIREIREESAEVDKDLKKERQEYKDMKGEDDKSREMVLQKMLDEEVERAIERRLRN